MLEGAFELMIMFFGLTNSPATFQTMMNDLLKDMIEAGNVATFSNNVIVGIETEEKHDKLVEEALKRIVKNDLFVKLKKCVWKVREIGFLEVMIEPDSIRIEKKKVQEVVDQLVLRSIKDVQKFLELANYYRWFVKDFARVAKPLHEITRKDIKWNWKEKQQRAFEELKERFTIEPVLVILDLDKEIRVEVEVLDFAMREVLSMKCKDEKQRPVAYIFKLLNKAKKTMKFTIKRSWLLSDAQRHGGIS